MMMWEVSGRLQIIASLQLIWKFKRMAGNFQVKRDLFSETNNITESIRSIVLNGDSSEDRQNKMVGVGG